jgi:hypothetical protein
LSNTATADSYGLGVSTSGTGTMRSPNFFDALPSQIIGRTANQAISNGGGAGISTTMLCIPSGSQSPIFAMKGTIEADAEALSLHSRMSEMFAAYLDADDESEDDDYDAEDDCDDDYDGDEE